MFLSVSFIKVKKQIYKKTAFYYTWLDAARRADSEYHIGFAPKCCPAFKNRDLLAKASVRGRLIAPAVLIDEKSRYDHR
jgi:hypothetical protein